MAIDDLRNDLIQGALIDYLKTKTTVTALLPSASSEEIRENQWQGREFSYPNIRLRLMSNIIDTTCSRNSITLSWEVRSQEASSYEADRLCGKIRSVLHDLSFNQNSIHFSLWTNDLVPAIREDDRTWRSELLMRGIVSG